MDEFSRKALKAKESDDEFNVFASERKKFILSCASKACKRFVNESDDEWSVSLIAFHEAVEKYDKSKGRFSSFSNLVIKRRLMDSFDKESRHWAEIATKPEVLGGEIDPEEAGAFDIEVSKAAKEAGSDLGIENPIKDEIDALNQELAPFGFELFDVAKDSPKAGRTKKSCAAAIMAIVHDEGLYDSFNRKKKLPYEELLKVDKVTKKVLERHRKYLIMAVTVLTGDYPHLAEYVRNITS